MTFVFIELMVNFFREIILTLLKAETVGEAGQKSLGKFSAAIGRWRKAVAAVAPKRRYGAPRRRKDYRSPRRFARIEAAGGAARFWSAPVLWRFGSGSRRTRRYPSGPRTPQVGKAVEDYRSPRRFARIEAADRAARFWSAPVLWRFEVELPKGVAETKRWTHASHWGKVVEDYRSPRRFATVEGGGKSARFWSAPVLWRFSSPFRRGIEVVGQIE